MDPADHVADLIRIALARIRVGDDWGSVLTTLAVEAYERGRRAPFADEQTPTVDVWAEQRPSSQRPTMPAPGLPKGVRGKR